MRRYEVVFVLAPSLAEEEVQASAENFKKVAEEKGAKVLTVDHWGKRRLAFPVLKHTEGSYVVMTLEESAADAVTELERRFKVSDAVIRFLSVRIDLELKRAAKFDSQRELRKKKRAAYMSRSERAEPVEAVGEKE